MGKESKLERKMCDYIEERGCMSFKMTCIKGIPDRLVLLPGGKVFFLEVKEPNGVLSHHQKNFISRLQKHFCKCLVCSDFEEFKISFDKILAKHYGI